MQNNKTSVLDYILESNRTYFDCSTKRPSYVNLAKRAWINILDSNPEEQDRAMSPKSINGIKYACAYGVPIYVEGRAILWSEYTSARKARSIKQYLEETDGTGA